MLLLEPYTYFIDHSLGGKQIAALYRDHGRGVHILREVFPQDINDVDWLPKVGANGWVVLTKDKDIRRNEVERAALFGSNVAAFIFRIGGMKGEQVANVALAALPRIERALRVHEAPFIARVADGGSVTMLYGNDGNPLPKPLVIR